MPSVHCRPGGWNMDGLWSGRWISTSSRWVKQWARWFGRVLSSRWSLARATVARGYRKAIQTPRRALVIALTVALVGSGTAVASTGAGFSLSDIGDWLQSLFSGTDAGTGP